MISLLFIKKKRHFDFFIQKKYKISSALKIIIKKMDSFTRMLKKVTYCNSKAHFIRFFFFFLTTRRLFYTQRLSLSLFFFSLEYIYLAANLVVIAPTNPVSRLFPIPIPILSFDSIPSFQDSYRRNPLLGYSFLHTDRSRSNVFSDWIIG